MGCGRSQHQSPSVQSEHGVHRDRTDNVKDSRDDNQREGNQTVTKPVAPPEAESPVKNATNGSTLDVKSDWQVGEVPIRSEGVAKPQWSFEETVDTPPETVVATYRSSIPASARAPVDPAPNPTSPHSCSSNGALLNGHSHRDLHALSEDEMEMEIQEKTYCMDQTFAGGTKPVHITNSQQEFFKMLDEKIEKGADYNSDDD